MLKVSELSTDNGLDVLCELTPYIGNIATCENLHREFDKMAKVKRADLKSKFQQIVYGADIFSALIPILLKERRADVYGILSVLNECTTEDVAKQPITKTIADIKELFKDAELVRFFKSFVDVAPVK